MTQQAAAAHIALKSDSPAATARNLRLCRRRARSVWARLDVESASMMDLDEHTDEAAVVDGRVRFRLD